MFERLISMIIAAIIAATMGACGKDPSKPITPTVPPTEPSISVTEPTEDVVAPTEPEVVIPSKPADDVPDAPGQDNGETKPEEPPVVPPEDVEKPSKPTSPTPSTPEPSEPTPPKVEEDPAPTVPHTHTYKEIVIKPSCTKAGKTTYTCACGHSYSKAVSALGHNYGDYYYIEPTTEKEGREGRICKRCGHDVYQILEKLPVLATNADASEIEALIIKYINEYRAKEGACAASRMEGCDAYTQYRSEQMAAKGKADHDISDIRAAATAVKYGVYTDPSIYGLPGEPYYAIKGREAVGKDAGGTIDYVAKTLATGFYNSKSHWNYVGSDTNEYISVGVTEKNGRWYCCIVVAPVNLDERPNGV